MDTLHYYELKQKYQENMDRRKKLIKKIIKEDELDYFFNFSVDDYQISKIKYKKFLIQN